MVRNFCAGKCIHYLVGIAVMFFFCGNVQAQEKPVIKKPEVITTLFPLYDFARQVGGEKVDVAMLLPPGVEAHTFEPKPSDILKINKADIFIFTGKFMEPWAEDILKGVENKSLLTVDASQGITLMDETAHEHGSQSGSHAFEWAGSFNLEAGEYVWTFAKVGGNYADPGMKMVILQAHHGGKNGIKAAEGVGEVLLKTGKTVTQNNNNVLTASNEVVHQLVFDESKEVTQFRIVITQKGAYVFLTEHMPAEFEAKDHYLKDSNGRDVEPVAAEPEAQESRHGEENSHQHNDHHGHHHGGKDPHIWTDFGNAQQMVTTIASALCEKDGSNCEFYRKNAETYKAKLADIDNRYKTVLADCRHRTLLYGGHFAFGYLAHRYGLKHKSPYKGLHRMLSRLRRQLLNSLKK